MLILCQPPQGPTPNCAGERFNNRLLGKKEKKPNSRANFKLRYHVNWLAEFLKSVTVVRSVLNKPAPTHPLAVPAPQHT